MPGQHRLADELVPEGVRGRVEAQHARGHALVDGVGVDVWHGVDQGRFDAGADHRGGLQGQPRLRGESMDPREDGLLHR